MGKQARERQLKLEARILKLKHRVSTAVTYNLMIFKNLSIFVNRKRNFDYSKIVLWQDLSVHANC